jgi:hypothetical protein
MYLEGFPTKGQIEKIFKKQILLKEQADRPFLLEKRKGHKRKPFR